jgi:hypothetical protein
MAFCGPKNSIRILLITHKKPLKIKGFFVFLYVIYTHSKLNFVKKNTQKLFNVINLTQKIHKKLTKNRLKC